MIPLPSAFALAVAYALTKKAASKLVEGPKNFVSDWPPSPCRYYILTRGVVIHGDAISESTIGETENRIGNFFLAMNYILKFLPLAKVPARIGSLAMRKVFEKISMYLTKYIQRF